MRLRSKAESGSAKLRAKGDRNGCTQKKDIEDQKRQAQDS